MVRLILPGRSALNKEVEEPNLREVLGNHELDFGLVGVDDEE